MENDKLESPVVESQVEVHKSSWLEKVGYVIVFIFIVVVVVGLFSDDEKKEGNLEVSRVECLSVPDVIVDRLNSGLNINGGGSIRNLKAVKSTDFESIYFISGDLQGAGLEGSGDIATFATNKLDYTGLTLSVDTVAVEFSDWPDVSTTNLGVSRSNKGYSESRKCVSSS